MVSLLAFLRRAFGVSGGLDLIESPRERRVLEERRRTERYAADRRACFPSDWMDAEVERRAALAVQLNAEAGE